MKPINKIYFIKTDEEDKDELIRNLSSFLNTNIIRISSFKVGKLIFIYIQLEENINYETFIKIATDINIKLNLINRKIFYKGVDDTKYILNESKQERKTLFIEDD